MEVVKSINTGYAPRKHQQILHEFVRRFNVIVCHRRFGKTVWAINETLDRALRNPLKNPQYAYVAPFYSQAKRVAWDYVKDYTRNIPGVTVNEAELRVDIPRPDRGDRIRIFLVGAENPDALRGIYLDGVILDEFADMNPVIWTAVLRPAISDRLGWAIFLGTPKGQNHFYDMYKLAEKKQAEGDVNWFAGIFRASETGVVLPSELEDARATMSEEEYEQEYECSFTAALIGAYYGKQLSEAERTGRICSVPYYKGFEVDTFWDLGMDDSTAIWFIQRAGREWHVIDYLEDSGRDLSEYAADLKKRNYNYGRHYLPHDAAVRELSNGKSRQESLRLSGISPSTIVPKQPLADGINAVRMILGTCYFDKVKCARGIQSLQNYQKKWDPKNKIYSSNPLHNWASHGADSFRTFAMGVKEDMTSPGRRKLPRMADNKYDILG